MDCPSEEQMIRMKLGDHPGIQSIAFDIANRRVDIFHEGSADSIFIKLNTLRLNTELVQSVPVTDSGAGIRNNSAAERATLWKVLLINAALFVLEIVYGFVSGSMGLLADSLDMLADSFVYALALIAVGGSLVLKRNVARVAGLLQLALAFLGFAEVIRRFMSLERIPDVSQMVLVSLVALAGNTICLYLLQRSRSEEVHMRASMIFTSNDVIVNVGVILAAGLVHYFQSAAPDLVIGTIVFLLVSLGAYRILNLAR
jgi:Co/Zn/Cd efflux system component